MTHAIADEFLLDHATGAASAPVSLLVATHLALNPAARRSYRQMESLGGVMLDTIEPTKADPDALAKLFARIDRGDGADFEHAFMPVTTRDVRIPAPLAVYTRDGLDRLEWKQLTRGVEEAPLAIHGKQGDRAMLLRIAAGRAIPKHSHRGIELTLVLDGAFGDARGVYARGDVCAADETIEHQPTAELIGDCLCLVVSSGPVRLTGPFMRLLNPFLTR